MMRRLLKTLKRWFASTCTEHVHLATHEDTQISGLYLMMTLNDFGIAF